VESLADLIVGCIPHLRRYARALTRDREEADDLVQDTLERAWKHVHRWRGESDMRRWLFAILHNVHVNHLRRQRRAPPKAPLEDAVDTVALGSAEMSEEVRSVGRAFQELPGDHREVLVLVAVEQLSYRQTAELLGIPIGTVMSRLSRARDGLRSALLAAEARVGAETEERKEVGGSRGSGH
jgi:RNA polymerase sigma-70 factor (ECF subfamily)